MENMDMKDFFTIGENGTNTNIKCIATSKVDSPNEIRIKYFDGARKLEINEKGNCIDVYANDDIFIPFMGYAMIPLGFALGLPKGVTGRLMPRSSTFKTWGCLQTNSIGKFLDA